MCWDTWEYFGLLWGIGDNTLVYLSRKTAFSEVGCAYFSGNTQNANSHVHISREIRHVEELCMSISREIREMQISMFVFPEALAGGNIKCHYFSRNTRPTNVFLEKY